MHNYEPEDIHNVITHIISEINIYRHFLRKLNISKSFKLRQKTKMLLRIVGTGPAILMQPLCHQSSVYDTMHLLLYKHD